MKMSGQNGQMNNLNINAAMRYIYDQMERCLVYNYCILGEAGRDIFEGKQIEAPEIVVGIKIADFTPNVLSLFQEWGYTLDEKGNYLTSFEGVPIKFQIIKRKYEFLKRPDTKFYDVDEYKIPNPFEKYWKARFLVQ